MAYFSHLKKYLTPKFNWHKFLLYSGSQTSQTGGLLYMDTSTYQVSLCLMVGTVPVAGFHMIHCCHWRVLCNLLYWSFTQSVKDPLFWTSASNESCKNYFLVVFAPPSSSCELLNVKVVFSKIKLREICLSSSFSQNFLSLFLKSHNSLVRDDSLTL